MMRLSSLLMLLAVALLAVALMTSLVQAAPTVGCKSANIHYAYLYV